MGLNIMTITNFICMHHPILHLHHGAFVALTTFADALQIKEIALLARDPTNISCPARIGCSLLT
jgi:hypothetical protein